MGGAAPAPSATRVRPVSVKIASVMSAPSPGIRRRVSVASVPGPAPAAKSGRDRRVTAPVRLSTAAIISRYGCRSGAFAARTPSSAAAGRLLSPDSRSRRARGRAASAVAAASKTRQPAGRQITSSPPSRGAGIRSRSRRPMRSSPSPSIPPASWACRAGPAAASIGSRLAHATPPASRTWGDPASSRRTVVTVT